MPITFSLQDQLVFIRCSVCGCRCPLPPNLTAAGLREFVDQHPVDADAGLHATDCPTWSGGRAA